MIDLHYWPTPNGHKITMFLEEAGLAYAIKPVNIVAGDQFKPDFLKLSPNNRMPAIVDRMPADGGAPVSVFESGAILVYLAEKTGRFLPHDARARAEAMQWLFQATTDTAGASGMVFVMSRLIPDKSDANMAFCEERTLRYLRVADGRLADREYLAGELSVAYFALYPLAALRRPLIDRAGDMPHLLRWSDAIGARPGVTRGMNAAA